MQLLDQFGNINSELAKYQENYQRLKQLTKELNQLIESKTSRSHRLDYLQYQLNEIQLLSPTSQDEEALLEKKSQIINFEKNQKMNSTMDDIFIGGESSSGLLNQLKTLQSLYTKNQDLFSEDLSKLCVADDLLNELYYSFKKKLHSELDPRELDGVIERLDHYTRLKKKFGGNVIDIIKTQENFLKEKEQLESVEIILDDKER